MIGHLRSWEIWIQSAMGAAVPLTSIPLPFPGVAFTMADAYAWNITQHDFLMHPKPAFHYMR